MGLLDLLRLPETRGIGDLDDPAATQLHARIIQGKPFLRRIYHDIYAQFRDTLPPTIRNGRIVELGSGGGFIKEVIPNAITSDILHVPGLDVCFSALDMPFADGSLDAILMIDVLHHLPNVARFLAEASRCLRPSGRILMVEPANTLWGRFIYTRFHHEPFDPSGGWTLDGSGPLSSANGALPWIVFGRDRARLDREFPQLTVRQFSAHTPLRYLLSGGVSMRQLVPSWTYGLVRRIERCLTPLHGAVGMFYFIDLERRGRG